MAAQTEDDPRPPSMPEDLILAGWTVTYLAEPVADGRHRTAEIEAWRHSVVTIGAQVEYRWDEKVRVRGDTVSEAEATLSEMLVLLGPAHRLQIPHRLWEHAQRPGSR